MTFKVGFNRQGLNATDVAKKIGKIMFNYPSVSIKKSFRLTDSIKDKLKEATGVEIVSAGVGDKVNHCGC